MHLPRQEAIDKFKATVNLSHNKALTYMYLGHTCILLEKLSTCTCKRSRIWKLIFQRVALMLC